jgi:2-C-methyl-D-erythritol 2,4-cyclodiphosphate synthase
LRRLTEKAWHLVNVDIIIFAQEPKLATLKSDIRRNLAQLLRLDVTSVNVKAKTGEGVGAIGRAEAISCQAAVLIDQ